MPWVKELKVTEDADSQERRSGELSERWVSVRWNVETLRGIYRTLAMVPR